MLLAVRDKTASSVMDTTSVPNQNIMSVETTYDETSLRFILVYGPQESGPQEEYNVEERKSFYDDLAIEIENSFINNSIPIILGDLNAKIQNTDGLTAVSRNGQLLVELIQRFDLEVCNFHAAAEGTFTRISMKKGKEEKSTLDYIISTKAIFDSILEFIVDEEKMETPFRTMKLRNSKITTKYSDHCSLTATYRIDCNKAKETPTRRWIINQQGLDKFLLETEPPFFKVENSKDININYNQFISKLKETMGKCFKEKEINCGIEMDSRNNRIKKIIKHLKKYRQLGKSQRTAANMYLQKIKDLNAEKVHQENINKMKEAYQNLNEDGKFSTNLFWKLSKSVCKKKRDNKSSVINGENEIFGEIAIINAYKDEFSYRLRNRKIEDGMEEFQQSLELLVSMYLEHAETVKVQENFTVQELKYIIKKLASKKAPGMDGITTELLKSAGDGLLQGLLDIFNFMKNNIVVPQQWEQVVITTIYKGKGKRKELVNYRGIFLTSILCKIFEKLIKSRIDEILDRVSKFQAGAKNNRSPADQLFLLRGAIDHMVYMNKPVYITLYDFRQAFDSLWLKDCILSLWNLGVQNAYLPLIYKLNKKAVVTVNTPHGRTAAFDVEQIVKQGAVLASNICSVSTAEICDVDSSTPIGMLSLPPLAFVDDIAKLNVTENEVRSSHARTVSFSKLKKLEVNETKCYGLAINGKKHPPFPALYVNEKVIKVEKATKYLGDIINHKNNNEDMLCEKVKKAIGKLISIFATVNDVTLGVYQYNALVLLYHSYYLPTLIFNCQSWTNITNKDITKLRTLQLKYLKRMLRVPQATANCFVYLETGILPIDHEIWRRQLTYLHHILNLDDNDPVKVLYTQMVKLVGEKNWGNNMRELRSRYNINESDDEIKEMEVEKFKNIVRTNIEGYVFKQLTDECSTKTKTKHLHYTSFTQQKYLTTLVPKTMYTVVRMRCGMLNTDSSCRLCGLGDESIHHIVNCYVVSAVTRTVPPTLYTDISEEDLVKDIALLVEKFYQAVDEVDGLDLQLHNLI